MSEKIEITNPILKHYAKVTYSLDLEIDWEKDVQIIEVESLDVNKIKFNKKHPSYCVPQEVLEFELFDEVTADCKCGDKIFKMTSKPINNKTYFVGNFLSPEEAIKESRLKGYLAQEIIEREKDSIIGVGENGWDYILIANEEDRKFMLDPKDIHYVEDEQK